MRQSNTTFSAILTKISGGVPLDTEEMAVIQSRFKTQEWCDENVRDAVRLFHDNRSVDEYNSRAIRDPEYDSIARDSFAGYKTEEELAKPRKELHRMKTTEWSLNSYITPPRWKTSVRNCLLWDMLPETQSTFTTG